MRKIFVFTLSFVCLLIKAQEEKIDFSKVKAPSSPAFSILGVFPNDISRPKSYQELETSLMSNFTNETGAVLPDQFGLEFSPYWMKSNPELTYKQATNPSIGQSLMQNLSISLANAYLPSFRDTSRNNVMLGLGLRSRIDFGEVSKKSQTYITKRANIEAEIKERQAVLVGILAAVEDDKFPGLLTAYQKNNTDQNMKNILDLFKAYIGKPDDFKQINSEEYVKEVVNDIDFKSDHAAVVAVRVEQQVDAVANDVDGRVKKLAMELESLNMEVEGFFIEIALGSLLDFPTNNFEYSDFSRLGFWITPGYKFGTIETKNGKNLGGIELMGYLRFMWDDISSLSTSNTDIGTRLVYSMNKLSFSIEYLHRWQTLTLSQETSGTQIITTTDNLEDNKAVVTFEYRLTSDLSLNYSLGEGFTVNNFNINDPSGFISLAGLNYAIGGWDSETKIVE